jgi:hypothetical protein
LYRCWHIPTLCAIFRTRKTLSQIRESISFGNTECGKPLAVIPFASVM